MAIIPQAPLFGWEQIDQLGDLERLVLVLKHLPDEQLMVTLERERGNGRDDYPVRPTWNSLIAGIVFQHRGIEELRRELRRNAQLRLVCGFDLVKGEAAVPTSWAYSRFLQSLFAHEDLVNGMFDKLVNELCELLPDFGHVLAMDAKGIQTHARPRRKDAPTTRDGRRDLDASWGRKTRKEKKQDGSVYEKVVEWFGYKLHLLVDATYDLPIAYTVTPAADADITQAPELLKQAQQRAPQVIERCEALDADKGYDDTKLITSLWDDYRIKPVIPIRDMWKDGEPTRVVSGTRNVIYDYKGTVSCVCMSTGEQREMAYGGFEKDRDTLQYRCPAIHYGIGCPDRGQCHVNKCVRIKLDEDRRVFVPMARSSYAWERTYKLRSSVERVNSRIDGSFCFEQHYIRGLQKMRLRCGLALIVMAAMAVGCIKKKQEEKMRSLVWAA